MAIELTIPDLGDFEDVDVIEVLVSPGDTVDVDDSLVVLETDKASMDIPAINPLLLNTKPTIGSLMLVVSMEPPAPTLTTAMEPPSSVKA